MATIKIIHRASICGYVRDAETNATIAGATVEIVGRNAQTRSRDDGFYHFLDVPDGAYTLHAAAPMLGSRYADVTVANVVVASQADGRPSFDPRGNLNLPPTRLSGHVQRSGTLAPIARAEVRLRAAGVRTLSDDLGHYVLSPAQAGEQTVQVSAPGFAAGSQRVALTAGQSTTADFVLTPS